VSTGRKFVSLLPAKQTNGLHTPRYKILSQIKFMVKYREINVN